MQVKPVHSKPKSMPISRASREPLVFTLVWLLFCAVIVVVALFLTPRIGEAYASDDLTIPQESPAPAPVNANSGHAVRRMITLLYRP